MLRLRLSVIILYCIEMAGRIQFFLADWLPSFYVLERNSGVSENDGSSLWNFVPNFRLEKFYYGTWTVSSAVKLVRPSTVTSLWHWLSTVVTHRVARVRRLYQLCYVMLGWFDSRVVNRGPGFKSQSRRCRVTVLGKLFTPTVPLFTKQQKW